MAGWRCDISARFTIFELDTIQHLHTVHPSLQFISHIPHSITGEQLVNQFLRCIPDRTWLFKYGRVPLNLIMGEWVWQVSSSEISSYVQMSLQVLLFLLFACLGFLFVCFFSFGSLSLHLDIDVGGASHFHRARVSVRPVRCNLNGARCASTPSPIAHMSPEGHTGSASFLDPYRPVKGGPAGSRGWRGNEEHPVPIFSTAGSTPATSAMLLHLIDQVICRRLFNSATVSPLPPISGPPTSLSFLISVRSSAMCRSHPTLDSL